jgi:transcriptional regulator with XRE-family HTH domain
VTDEDIDRAIGAQIRATREAKGWTLGELADRSDGEFKLSGIGMYERGARSITTARLIALARVLGVNPCALLPA